VPTHARIALLFLRWQQGVGLGGEDRTRSLSVVSGTFIAQTRCCLRSAKKIIVDSFSREAICRPQVRNTKTLLALSQEIGCLIVSHFPPVISRKWISPSARW